ncbi:hypothetical protein P8452_58009 [Trifolium repens]|nr:hypothetical protein P8452_58009 [Trifolium repens]
MASKKSSKKKKPQKKHEVWASYPRTRRISLDACTEEEKKKRKMYLYKPVPNVVWKEIQKFRKEKAARDKARSISKKKMKRSQAKIRKKEQPFVCNVMHI